MLRREDFEDIFEKIKAFFTCEMKILCYKPPSEKVVQEVIKESALETSKKTKKKLMDPPGGKLYSKWKYEIGSKQFPLLQYKISGKCDEANNGSVTAEINDDTGNQWRPLR